MQIQSLQSRLDALIEERSLLKHSFYTRWQAGELAREELQGYAKEYYQFEKEFPRFLTAIHSRCEDSAARQSLLANLVHEEQGDNNHPELWLQFAEGVGAARESVQSHFHSDETEYLLRTFRKHSQSGDTLAGLAALYAYEQQQPEVARQKIEGLRKFYSVEDGPAIAFFKAHQTYDVEHSETEISLLSRLCTDELSANRVARVVEETLGALYEFLDGVERRYQKAA